MLRLSALIHFPWETSHLVLSGQQCLPSLQQTALKRDPKQCLLYETSNYFKFFNIDRILDTVTVAHQQCLTVALYTLKSEKIVTMPLQKYLFELPYKEERKKLKC